MSEVPQTVDPQLLRRDLQGLLRKPATELFNNCDPSNEPLQTISLYDGPSDSTDSTRSENPSIVALRPGNSSTDPTSDKSSSGQQPSNIPETHLLQAKTELKIRTTNLTAFCKILGNLEAQVVEARTLH